MPVYVWKGVNRMGQPVSGERVAANEEEALRLLRREGIQVTQIKAKGFRIQLPFLRKKVKLRDLAVFTRQLAVMINAGLPLDQALTALSQQQPNKTFKKAIDQVIADVQAGSSLSNALSKHPHIFDSLYVNMVAAGEAGGTLDVILERLALYIEKITSLVGKVRSALAYPIAVLIMAVGIVSLILWKVIPTFAKLYEEMGTELPLPTRVVIAMSNFLLHQFWLILLIIFGIVMAYKLYYQTEAGKLTIDRFKLKIWIIGKLILKGAIAKVMRTLATLVTSGVEILSAIEIAAKTAGNAVIEKELMDAKEKVAAGKNLSEPLKESKYFPPMVTQMIDAGEQTGAMDVMLTKIADFFDEEVDAAVSALISVLEPIMILFLGGIIGGIIVSMYLPIFNLISKF